MPATRSKGRTQDTRTPTTDPPRLPGTPGTPVPRGNMEPDLEAPLLTPAPPAPVVPPPPAPVVLPPAPSVALVAPVQLPVPVVQLTDPVLDHALSLVGFNRSRNPDHPVFQCLADGGYDTFHRLFFLNPDEVRELAYLDTSVSPPIWVSLSRGNQSALLILLRIMPG